ncbi:hypothetical protein FIBSPDRAFT_880678, partial [Athelia psychrophila]
MSARISSPCSPFIKHFAHSSTVRGSELRLRPGAGVLPSDPCTPPHNPQSSSDSLVRALLFEVPPGAVSQRQEVHAVLRAVGDVAAAVLGGLGGGGLVAGDGVLVALVGEPLEDGSSLSRVSGGPL